MIKISNVYKTFDKKIILDDFNLEIETGSIFALVGPNGAGKTTILKHITGIYKADKGSIDIDGEPVYENEKIKQKIAFVPDNLYYYSNSTATELGKRFANYYDDFDIDFFEEALSNFELDRKKKIKNFSKGMSKQAVFALQLAIKPAYLILDEPIDGLDPLMRRKVWRYISEATKDRSMTTIVSSHNLKEMDGICDNVAIVKDGHVALSKKLDDLKSSVHKIQIAYKRNDDGSKSKDHDYKKLNTLGIEKQGAVDLVIARNTQEELDAFAEKEKPILFNYMPLTLEEIFVYEIGGENEISNII